MLSGAASSRARKRMRWDGRSATRALQSRPMSQQASEHDWCSCEQRARGLVYLFLGYVSLGASHKQGQYVCNVWNMTGLNHGQTCGRYPLSCTSSKYFCSILHRDCTDKWFRKLIDLNSRKGDEPRDGRGLHNENKTSCSPTLFLF